MGIESVDDVEVIRRERETYLRTRRERRILLSASERICTIHLNLMKSRTASVP